MMEHNRLCNLCGWGLEERVQEYLETEGANKVIDILEEEGLIILITFKINNLKILKTLIKYYQEHFVHVEKGTDEYWHSMEPLLAVLEKARDRYEGDLTPEMEEYVKRYVTDDGEIIADLSEIPDSWDEEEEPTARGKRLDSDTTTATLEDHTSLEEDTRALSGDSASTTDSEDV